MFVYPQIDMGELGSLGGAIRGCEPGTDGRSRSVSMRIASRRGRLSIERDNGRPEFIIEVWLVVEGE